MDHHCCGFCGMNVAVDSPSLLIAGENSGTKRATFGGVN
jgi:hypothetical protein